MKRTLSLFLAAIMVLTVIPAALPIAAEEGTAEIEAYAAAPSVPEVEGTDVVYVDAANETGDTTYKTLSEAISAIADNGGTVKIVGTYTMGGTFTEPAHSGVIKIMAEEGGKILLADTTGNGNKYYFGGDTVLEGITFEASEANDAIVFVGNFYNTSYVNVTIPSNSNIIGGVDSGSGDNYSKAAANLIIDTVTGLNIVYGFGTDIASGTYTNELNVSVANTSAKALYGSYGCTAPTFGNVTYTIDSCSFSDKIVGAGNEPEGAKYGNVTFDIVDTKITGTASTNVLVGGSYGGTSTVGDVDITVSDNSGANTSTKLNYLYGLSYDGTITAGDVNLIINGGTLNKFVYGCGYKCIPTANNVTVNVNGGVFGTNSSSAINSVACGTYQGAGSIKNATINLNEGFKNNIGGLLGLNYQASTTASSTNITIKSGAVNQLIAVAMFLVDTNLCPIANVTLDGAEAKIGALQAYRYASDKTINANSIISADTVFNIKVLNVISVSNLILGGTNNTADGKSVLLRRVNLLWLKGTLTKMHLGGSYSDTFVYYDGTFSASGCSYSYTPTGASEALSGTFNANTGTATNIDASLANREDYTIGSANGEKRVQFKQIAKDGKVYVDNSNTLNVNNSGTEASPVYDLMDAMWLLGGKGGTIYLMSDLEVGKTTNWATGANKREYSSCVLVNGVDTFIEPAHEGEIVVTNYKHGDARTFSTVTYPAGGYVGTATFDVKANVFDHVVINNGESEYYDKEGKFGIRANFEISVDDIDGEYKIVEFGTLALPSGIEADLNYFAGTKGYGKVIPTGNEDAAYIEQNADTKVAKYIHYVRDGENAAVENYLFDGTSTEATYYSAMYSEKDGFKAATINFRGYALVEVAEGDIAVVYGDTVSACYNTLAATPAA